MLLAAQTEPVTLHCHTPIPAMAAGNWQGADPELPMLLLAKGALTCQANLLQGPIVPRPNTPATGCSGARWRCWQAYCCWWPWCSAVCICTSWRNRTRPSRRRSGRSTPGSSQGETRIVNVRSQMTQHLQQLGQAPQDGVLLLLTELAPVFAEVPGLKPEVLRFDAAQGELRLQVTAPASPRSNVSASWRASASRCSRVRCEAPKARSKGAGAQGEVVMMDKLQSWWRGISARAAAGGGGGSVLLIGLFYWAIWQPVANRIAERERQVVNQQQTLAWLKEKGQEVLAMQGDRGARSIPAVPWTVWW